MGSFVRNSYVSTLCPVVVCPYLCNLKGRHPRVAALRGPSRKNKGGYGEWGCSESVPIEKSRKHVLYKQHYTPFYRFPRPVDERIGERERERERSTMYYYYYYYCYYIGLGMNVGKSLDAVRGSSPPPRYEAASEIYDILCFIIYDILSFIVRGCERDILYIMLFFLYMRYWVLLYEGAIETYDILCFRRGRERQWYIRGRGFLIWFYYLEL